ncbi:hypothetical protein ACEV8E_22705, partial [Vibrio parahaemolyticus]
VFRNGILINRLTLLTYTFVPLDLKPLNHTLNQTATDDELRLLSSLIERDFFQPAQRTIIESFVSRKSIENYLNAHTSNVGEANH